MHGAENFRGQLRKLAVSADRAICRLNRQISKQHQSRRGRAAGILEDLVIPCPAVELLVCGRLIGAHSNPCALAVDSTTRPVDDR